MVCNFSSLYLSLSLIVIHFLTVDMNTSTLPVNLNYKIIFEQRSGYVLFRKYYDEREFLLLKMSGDDYWSFPEGPIKLGEGEMDGAERQLLEKTGITLDDICEARDYEKVVTHGYLPVNTTFFRLAELCYTAKRLRTPLECEEHRWVTLQEAYPLVSNSSKLALNACVEHLIEFNC